MRRNAIRSRVREGGKPGFPKFKSRRHSRQSYRTNGGKVVDRNHIALPKLGTVRAKVSRPLQGRFMSVTVSLDAAGRYFATFLCTDVPAKEASATDREVGIDLGVETLATLSDGTKIGNPRHLKKYERKLAREQRRLSRRKGARRDEKPSDRYLKQRKRVARIHAKIADARTDALHKVTTMLADENQVLCMEDLNAKGMVRNRRLAKAVSDASFGEFARLLEYKCAERGRSLVKIGTNWLPSLATVMMRSIPQAHPKRRIVAWDINRKSAATRPNCSMMGNRLKRLHPRSINRKRHMEPYRGSPLHGLTCGGLPLFWKIVLYAFSVELFTADLALHGFGIQTLLHLESNGIEDFLFRAP